MENYSQFNNENFKNDATNLNEDNFKFGNKIQNFEKNNENYGFNSDKEHVNITSHNTLNDEFFRKITPTKRESDSKTLKYIFPYK